VGGNPHDRPGAVVGQDEVGHPDRHGLAGEGVDRPAAGVDALLVDLPGQPGRSVQGAKATHPSPERRRVRPVGRDALDERMLRREQNERGPVDGVDAGREHLDGVLRRFAPAVGTGRAGKADCASGRAAFAGQGEADQRAVRAADPVALHRQHLVRPLVQLLRSVEQLVGILRDPQEPLLQVARPDRRAAAPAAAVHHLLVGQHGPAVGAPVHRRLPAVGEPPLVHLQEQPLVPPVVLRVAGRDLALPGVADPEPLQLVLHVRDVLARPGLGVRPVLDRGVLGGHAEGVPTERMEHVVTAHPLHARHDVADHVVAHVSDVGVAGRVGEHHEAVELRPVGVRGHLEGAALPPAPLPFLLYRLGVVVAHEGDCTSSPSQAPQTPCGETVDSPPEPEDRLP